MNSLKNTDHAGGHRGHGVDRLDRTRPRWLRRRHHLRPCSRRHRRPGALRRHALAQPRPGARRSLDRRRRQRAPPERVLVRRHRRRRLEDHRRRHQLGADDRRQDHHLVDRLARRLPVATPTSSTSAAARREFRGNIIQGDGIYKTTDGGKTWTHLPQLRDSQAIARIRVHPTNCDIVYAAVFGQVYNDHPERGVFKSTDGGKTCKKTLYRDEKTPAVDLSIDPKNPNVMFAALWEANRSPWGMSSGGPGSGLFKSTDGGDTWTEITKNPGLPAGLWGKVGVSVSPADGNRVYALIENEKGGLYVSDDAGATWKLINENRNLRQRAFYYTRLLADPKDKDTVYVLNVQFFKSTDGGKTTTTIRVAARRQPRPVDRGHRQPAHGAGQRRRRQRLGERRPHVDRPGLSRPGSSTTSSPPSTCRITSAARSRTTPRRASAARRTRAPARAACRRSSTRSAAARAATSRRIRTT